MSALQDHARGTPCDKGFFPTLRAKAPFVPGDEPWKTIFGPRGNQIVSPNQRVFQELLCDPGTDDMASDIIVLCPTAAISEEAGEGIQRAGDKFCSKHIFC